MSSKTFNNLAESYSKRELSKMEKRMQKICRKPPKIVENSQKKIGKSRSPKMGLKYDTIFDVSSPHHPEYMSIR